MSGKLPVDTVLAFLEQINAGNVDGLCTLMTEDHLFVDGLGNRGDAQGLGRILSHVSGLSSVAPGRFSQGDGVAAFGSAEGTLAVKGELPKENHSSVPATWRAVVRDGLIAEWQVYADNQSARKIAGVQNP